MISKSSNWRVWSALLSLRLCIRTAWSSHRTADRFERVRVPCWAYDSVYGLQGPATAPQNTKSSIWTEELYHVGSFENFDKFWKSGKSKHLKIWKIWKSEKSKKLKFWKIEKSENLKNRKNWKSGKSENLKNRKTEKSENLENLKSRKIWKSEKSKNRKLWKSEKSKYLKIWKIWKSEKSEKSKNLKIWKIRKSAFNFIQKKIEKHNFSKKKFFQKNSS